MNKFKEVTETLANFNRVARIGLNQEKIDKQEIIERLQALKRYVDLAKSPEEFFKHMQGHRTELSIVLATFDIANMSEVIISALEQQLAEQKESGTDINVGIKTIGDKIRESNESLASHLAKYGVLMESHANEDRLFEEHLKLLNQPLTE